MIALLYDVHGNLPALEAVLADAREQGATEYVVGGDMALFGPWPAETIGRLRELDGSHWIRGNGERWTGAPDEAPDNEVVPGAVEACRAELGDPLVRDLALLPESHVIGDATRCWHGSPVSDVRSFLPEPADDEAELLADVAEARLVFGHTHVPFRRRSPHRDVELVNPGSVGMPFDGDRRAAYALLAEEGGIVHRRVAYDHAASAAALRDRFGGGWAEIVARRIETARF
jgi:predicted phosphodiesterase